MTVSSGQTKVIHTGNDTATEFSFIFKVFKSEDLVVIHTDASDPTVETTLIEGIDYTVDGAGTANGGSVTYPISGDPLPTGETITLWNNPNIAQELDLINQGVFHPNSIENALDLLTMFALNLDERLNRGVVLQISDQSGVDVILPSPRADTVVGWNNAGDALVNLDMGSVELAIPGDGSVTTAKLYDLAVTNAKLADESITAEKIDTTDVTDIMTKLGCLPLAGGTMTGPLLWSETGDEYIRVPRLTTVQRDILSASNGMLIYNTTTGQPEIYQAGVWGTIPVDANKVGGIVYAADSGAADVYVMTLAPAITALTTGMVVSTKIVNANLTTTPTMNVNGLGAKTIVRDGGQALVVGDLPADLMAVFRYTGTEWELLNPAKVMNESFEEVSIITQNGIVRKDYTVGDTLHHSNDTEANTTSATYVKLKEITLGTLVGSGSDFRIKFDLKSSHTIAVYGKIYINGTPVGTERIRTDTTYETFSEDFTDLEPGDLIQLYVHRGASTTAYVQNFQLYVAPIDSTILTANTLE